MAGWWSSDLGQATLSSVRRHLPSVGYLQTRWDTLQEGLAWRTFAWHKRRFQRRIERDFAGRWHEFDAAYVHGDTMLASVVSCFLPTVLRLPGPVTSERAPLLRTVHAVCANGDALSRVRSFLGDHVTELPVGLDTQIFRPAPSRIRARLQWAGHHCVLGYVGRLAHLKGGDILATAFREVAQSTPNARLLLIGSGEQESMVRQVLARELANGTVHIEHGLSHEELAAWYNAMDLFVMPSRYENHSNALLEAMACGVPFLASDVGGNRKLSESGAGILFESESVDSLTEKLLHLIENRRELETLRHNSSRLLPNQHTWATSAERLEGIIACRLGVR